MVQNIYSIRDVKTTFAPPFLDYNDDAAIRGMHYALVNQKSMFNFSPEDFRLYCIGTMDTISGEVVPCTPRFVCDAYTVLGLAPQDLKCDDRLEVYYEA